jgi:hypothetical protein
MTKQSRRLVAGVSLLVLVPIFLWWRWHVNVQVVDRDSNLASTPTPMAPLSRLDQFRAAIDFINNKRLVYYGRIIDQDQQPVAGAEVTGHVLTELGLYDTREVSHTTMTDANGDFAFTGLRGERLGIAPSKQGYDYIQRGNGNWAEGVVTAADSRNVITMWKLHGRNAMKKTHLHAGVPCDGTAVHFDIITGKRVAKGGQLTIKFSRTPVNIDRRKNYDWNLEIDVSGGGLQPVADFYPNLAPERGYSETVTSGMSAADPAWSPLFKKMYYLATEQGQIYGRISIELMGDYQPPPTNFKADVFLNTVGTRNLEFDEMNQIR